MLHPKRYLLGHNRVAFPYYHGHPDSNNPIFVDCFENLKHYHNRICRIQVTNSRIHDLVLSTGIDPAKVFLIPIGINMDFFHRQTPDSRKAMREKHKIPQDAVVIGSFQKDGNGWGEGITPKSIKGPDIFIKTISILKEALKDLYVLLSGPARGYVKNELDKIKVPYKHIYLKDYPQINELYQCLDLYIITSREEGGPKAVLESMASGIPLVTTRVGQAMDLVQHGKNGWIVDVEDAESLAYWAEKTLTDTSSLQEVLENGFRTAQSNTYESQAGSWKVFFHGFVETG
ncbi:MAG: glycosyltransferase family 4 protein [Deltaproteobacteria bacterium]|nr:glycosyltransferase family 4 protein [Deltaproteobacteria bacterium]